MRELTAYVTLLYHEYFQCMEHDYQFAPVALWYSNHIQIIYPKDVSPRLTDSFKHMLILYIEGAEHPQYYVETTFEKVTLIKQRLDLNFSPP